MTEIDSANSNFLSLWTKLKREATHCSQEALAAASGLNVRTIQRIEAGRPVNVMTRRALARGLGYDNPHVFEDPEFRKRACDFLKNIRNIQREVMQQQYPDCIPVSAERVTNGAELARIAYEANAYLFHADEAISDEAKETAASIFDFLRDLGDVHNLCSFTQRLGHERFLAELLEQLEALGAACYSAFRATEIV